MSEHPIQQTIRAIQIDTIPGVESEYSVGGTTGVTHIEACEKSGPYSSIPYLRVWAGETCLAEFCQHQIVGVYFEAGPVEPPAPRVPGICGECGKPEAGDDPALICDCLPF